MRGNRVDRRVLQAADRVCGKQLKTRALVEAMESRVLLAGTVGANDALSGATGSISGYVFSDPNVNWYKEPGEPGLPGATVFLDANKNHQLDPGEVWTTTDATGAYSFTGLSDGEYYLSAITPSGWGVMTASMGADIAGGGSVTDRNFPATQSALVDGRVFGDTNNDGILDGDERVLPGWTIYADQNGNGQLDAEELQTMSMLSRGGFTLVLPPSGTYTVRLQIQAGYHVTSANGGVYTVTANGPGIVGWSDFGVAPDAPPIANAGGPYTVNEGSSVILDGSGSSDNSGTITLYEWDLNYDGQTFNPTATGVNVTFSAAGITNPGRRTVALRVQDNWGRYSPVTTAMVAVGPLANDDMKNATVMAGMPGDNVPLTAQVDLLGATAENWETTAGLFPADSVWYAWTPAADGKYAVRLGATDQAGIGIYVQVNGGLDAPGYACAAGWSGTQFYGSAGTTYLIRVADSGWNTAPLALTLSKAQAPANDDLAGRMLITGAPTRDVPIVINGTLAQATAEPGEIAFPIWQPSSVWYEWTAPTNTILDYTLTGTSSPHVGVYTSPQTPACVGDLVVGGDPITSQSITAGTTYYIRVSNYYSYRDDPFTFTIALDANAPEPAVSIPDASLEAAVRSALGKPTGDITVADMQGLTTLSAQYSGIKSLSGLEYATNLNTLGMAGNQISDLSPLAGLTKLSHLYLNDNQISDLTPLAGLTGLQTLYLHVNQISDLSPLAGMTAMQTLELNTNKVSDLSPLAAMTGLSFLDLAGNQISDLSPLAGLTGLTRVYLTGNQISDLAPLSGLKAVVTLYLGSNHISDLSALSGLTGMTQLHLPSNQISDVSPLAGMTQLIELGLDANQVSDLSPLSEITGMESLYLLRNQVGDLSPLAGMTRMKTLMLEGNQISDLSPLAGMTGLVDLYLGNNHISDISALATLTGIKSLSLIGNQISDVSPLAGMVGMEELYLNANQISDLSPLAAMKDSGGLARVDVSLNHVNTAAGSASMAVIQGWLDGGVSVTYLPQVVLSANSVAEDQPAGTVVGALAAADSSAGDTFTYTLVSGAGSDDDASFQIVGNELRTAAEFNYEAKSSYTIRVRTAGSGGVSFETVFTISVTNVVETPIAWVIDGTPGDDVITLDQVGTDYQLSVNGTVTVKSVDMVSSIAINGLAGNDTITMGSGVMMGVLVYGGDGNDTITGGTGNDTIYGNAGDDLIDGGAGADCIMGGLGADTIYGGIGRDSLYGGDGADLIHGQGGADYIEGRGKNDTIYGDGGNDTLLGGAGNDLIYGGAGDDWIYVDDGPVVYFHDTVYGGTGTNHVDHDAGDTILDPHVDILA